MRTDVAQLSVLRPKTLREALKMMRDEGELTPLAGGTDLFVVLAAGAWPQNAPRRFIDLWGLDELRGIEVEGRGRGSMLRLGALTTFTDCMRSAAVRKRLPILARAAGEVGGVQVQNRGTLAGNLGNGSPAADGVPVLLAANATLTLESAEGGREVFLDDFYTGYRKTVRRPDELIVEIRVPEVGREQHFRKVGTRAAQAISKVVMAATAGEAGHRIAFGSVAPTVVRARSVERYLDGGGRDPVALRALVAADLHPIDDLRSTANYRLTVAQNLVAELL